MKWKLHQMDVKTSFLNGVIEEEVYIEQPPCFKTHDIKSHVCKSKKQLYGLKKTPIAWYGRINGFLMSLGFTKSKEDSNLYYKVFDEGIVILLLYFDDLFITWEEKLIDECKKNIST